LDFLLVLELLTTSIDLREDRFLRCDIVFARFPDIGLFIILDPTVALNVDSVVEILSVPLAYRQRTADSLSLNKTLVLD
jgi:hypothetical protein